MKIVNKHPNDIIPYKNNPRHNDEAVDKVAASINEFGFKVPIVIDTNNIIVSGHTRHKAALKLELEEIPCILADDLTDEQITAFRIADNKVAEFSSWDMDALAVELSELDEMDMKQFGFEEYDPDGADAEDDNFDYVLPEEPITKKGDVYLLGEHRLICGDAADKADAKELYQDISIDLLLTDPPYNVNYESADGKSIEY